MWLPRCKNTRQTTKRTKANNCKSGLFSARLQQCRGLSTAILRHGVIGFLVSFCVCTIAITGAYAQGITIDFNEGTSVTERAIQIIALVTVLSLAPSPVSYTHLRAHETPEHLVCRLLLEKKK